MGSNLDTLCAVAFSYDVDTVHATYRRAAIAEAMGHPAQPSKGWAIFVSSLSGRWSNAAAASTCAVNGPRNPVKNPLKKGPETDVSGPGHGLLELSADRYGVTGGSSMACHSI